MCIRAHGSGDVTRTHVAWMKKGNTAYVPSLLLAARRSRGTRLGRPALANGLKAALRTGWRIVRARQVASVA